MKVVVAVIAGHGRSGRVCVEALLAAGYWVRAGVRHGSLGVSHPNMTEVKLDATKPDDIARLVAGADVVVSMIGHTRRSKGDVQTQAIRACIDYLEAHRPTTRLISLTGTGVRQPGDRVSIFDWTGNFVIGLIDPGRISDGINHARLLEASTLHYTILRVLKLTNGPHEGHVRLTLNGPAESFTPRARIAAAVVELIRHDGYDRAMPVVSGTE